MSTAKKVTNHDEIRSWAEEHGGRPAVVEATAEEGGGILRFDFGEKEDALKEISWDDFFEIFEDRRLAVLLPDDKDGKSRFSKFVER